MSDALKAIKYAEETLGVHHVYHQAMQCKGDLEQCLDKLAEARSAKRDLEFRLQDKEMLLAVEERAKHPDMAVTRMEAHLKEVKSNDDDVREYRELIMGQTSLIEALEHDKLLYENEIRISVARLTELGGYLNYLAAVRQSIP